MGLCVVKSKDKTLHGVVCCEVYSKGKVLYGILCCESKGCMGYCVVKCIQSKVLVLSLLGCEVHLKGKVLYCMGCCVVSAK